MILCIGLIIAIYTMTRLGVGSFGPLFQMPLKVQAILQLVSVGLIAIVSVMMLFSAMSLEMKLGSL